VRPTGRPAQDVESLDAEMIGELADDVGPIQEPSLRLRAGQAMPGPVGRDEPHAQIREYGLIHRTSQPRAAGAVEVKDDLSCRIAIFGKAQRPLIPEGHGLVHVI
jgi:hypothetical protein